MRAAAHKSLPPAVGTAQLDRSRTPTPAWQAVVDTNARRYPRPMGPELPCPTDEQWQGRFLFSFETALW